MVNFKPIDEHNFTAIVNMKQPEGQNFVAPNVYSLAQAWLYREAGDVFPWAIYKDEDLVGFILLDLDEEEATTTIWRIMIDQEHQHRGYGTAALKLVIDQARQNKRFRYLRLDYVPGNTVAENLYRKVGFKPTGEIDNGEIVMQLEL